MGACRGGIHWQAASRRLALLSGLVGWEMGRLEEMVNGEL
jgi:hypothetical protein